MTLSKTISLFGLGAVALLNLPALADTVNARLKAVDATAHTLTVVEKKRDYTFSTSDATHFVNATGGELDGGLSSGALKPGARLSITYDKQGTQMLASEIKLRGTKKPAKVSNTAPTAPTTTAPAATPATQP